MTDLALAPPPRRNKGFDATHRAIIDTAVKLISEKGSEALSMAAIARAMGINRTTLYYHYASREDLLDAAKAWASEELAKGMDNTLSTPERISQVNGFVLDNPELVKLWIDDFISGSDIRDSYTKWDELVSGISAHFARERPGEEIDAEVYCVMMLSSAIIGPRVFAASVDPAASPSDVADRFAREQSRMLRRDGLAGLERPRLAKLRHPRCKTSEAALGFSRKNVEEESPMASLLPAGFEALDPFVDRFAIDGTANRAARRGISAPAERAAFHAAMVDLVGPAIDLLDTRDLDKFDAAEQRLMNLALSFAHIALAVEIQGPDEERHTELRSHMRITRSPADAAA